MVGYLTEYTVPSYLSTISLQVRIRLRGTFVLTVSVLPGGGGGRSRPSAASGGGASRNRTGSTAGPVWVVGNTAVGGGAGVGIGGTGAGLGAGTSRETGGMLWPSFMDKLDTRAVVRQYRLVTRFLCEISSEQGIL